MRVFSLLILIPVLLPTVYSEVICYSCISRIDSSLTTRSEQNALKTALFTRYNIPPSHERCQDGGTDLLFRTVAQETCRGKNDSCVKISTEDPKGQFSLTIRGCHSSILKPGYELGEFENCSNRSDKKCLSLCSTNLCNSGEVPQNILTISLLFIFSYLLQ